MPGAITTTGTQKAVFNAGSVIDINQRVNASVISALGKSTVDFISPKQMHLAIQDANGNPITTTAGIISGPGTVSINNSRISTWDKNNSVDNPQGDSQEKFTNLVIKNGNATLTTSGGVTSSSSILSRNTRELSTLAINPGKVYIQYKDKNGNDVGDPVEVALSDDAYIGQYINLVDKEFVEENMPEHYMWSLGDQISGEAIGDKQSQGDPTSTADDGDEYGQANIGIVPMEGFDYVYNVYVYGTKQDVQYQYVDVNTDKIIQSTLSGQSGDESASNLVPANYGNEINWEDDYYTNDHLPMGYHYSTTATQPTTTTVSEDNKVVQIFVEGNPQSIAPTYVTQDGGVLTPSDPITIDGVTGETVTIPDAPAVTDYAPVSVLVNGKLQSLGSTLELSDGTDTVEYIYQDLRSLRDDAKNTIDKEAQKVNDAIAGDETLTSDERAEQAEKVTEEAQIAKDNIDKAETVENINNARDEGVDAIDAAHIEGSSITVQKQDAKDAIDAEVAQETATINADDTLTSDEKAAQAAEVAQEADKAKDNIDVATDADGINEARDNGIEAIDGVHQSGDLEAAKQAAKDAIEAEATQETAAINADDTLTDAEKAEQTAAVENDKNSAIDSIDLATTANDVSEVKDNGIAAIDEAHIPGIAVEDQKQAAKDAIDAKAAQETAAINADDTLTADEKAAQAAEVAQEADTAKSNIDAATNADGINEARDNGIAAIDGVHQSGDLDAAKQTAKEAIDAEAAQETAAINADDTLTADEKAAQTAEVAQEADTAKNNIDAATNADGINDARDNGIEAIDEAHVPGTAVEDQKQAAKDAIDNEVSEQIASIDANDTLTSTEKADQKAKVLENGNIAKEHIDSVDSVNELPNTGVEKQNNSWLELYALLVVIAGLFGIKRRKDNK